MKKLLKNGVTTAILAVIYAIAAGMTPRHLGYLYREIRMGFPTIKLAFVAGYKEHESDIEIEKKFPKG
jgi:hypothetical protein